MIDPNNIISHIQRYLPIFTNIFSVELTASGVVSGNTVTFTATNHGLSVDTQFTITGGNFSNSLTSAVINPNGTTRFRTTSEHDLTEPRLVNDPKTLRLSGMGDPWDGEHNIVNVPNREFFDITTPSGQTNPPSLTNAVLVEDRSAGLNGFHSVASVPDANTFTINIAGIPSLPAGNVSSLSIVVGQYIYGAADIERAEAHFTQLPAGKSALYVVMTDADVSKDRHTLNDSVAGFTRQNSGKQIILQNFATIFITPTDTQSSGATAQNLAYGSLFRSLYSTLYGARINDPDTATPYVTVSNGHGPTRYNSAYYGHAYDWQTPSTLTFENGFMQQPSVAFRDIAQTLRVDQQNMTSNINLDEEPL